MMAIFALLHLIRQKEVASAGNRTRVARVAGEHSTTEPPMLHGYHCKWKCSRVVHVICSQLLSLTGKDNARTVVAAGTSTPRTFAAFKSSVPTDNFSSVKTNSYGTQTSRYGTETTRYGTQTSRYGTQTPTPSYPTGTYTPSASQTTNKAFTCTNYNPSFYVDNVNYDTYTTSRYHKALVQNESNPDPYFYVPSVVFQTIVDKLNATKNGDVYVVKCDQASLVPYRALFVPR
ncbi:hypothetical protein M3Y98_00797000 [Aphelenchoides besseyi]|nr:hypothetical protein M3Y98_00797000 [Aphelenchoides besseyi]